jgi:mono/diheme cytochrome c family protein
MAGRCGHGRARRGARLLTAAGLAALAAALAAGCGGSDASSPSTSSATTATVQVEHLKRDRWTYARARFHEMCAGCHTLADAGASGRRFDLDEVPDLNEELVRGAILSGGPGMPPFASLISYKEYEELAAYVLAVAQRNEGGEDRWQWQIALRRAGEHDRPAGWPPRSSLTVPRYNP